MSEGSAMKTTFSQKLGARAYLAFCAVLRLLDIRAVAVFGRCVGYFVWALMPGRRRIVARNMRIVADPTLKGRKLSALVRRNMVRTTMNMACTFKTGLMTHEELQRAVSLLGAESFEGKATDGQTIIGCIPHAGNWEILARIRPLFPKVKRFGSMYRRLDNPVLEEIVYKSRTRFGCEMFSNKKGLKEVFRLARDGGMLGVLSDQFTQQGIFLPYFGKVTGTTPLPALLYKRCRGNGHLFAVSTRNTALGKWDAVLHNEITLPEGDCGIATLTQAVNHGLEAVQQESILDGFWMHHRWKPTTWFAPEPDDEQKQLIEKYTRLPFRIILCVPEEFEEAVLVIPMMRCLRASRPDVQLTVLCPSVQKAFWETQPYIRYVVTTDSPESPADQLEADDLYKDGPYDYLFMLSSNARVFRNLQRLAPIYISGFASNPLSKKMRKRCQLPLGGEAYHKSEEYLELGRLHIDIKSAEYADAALGNASATGFFISPFSTLGEADSWAPEKWGQLVQKLPAKPTLLAFPEHQVQAEAMAGGLGIPCRILKPEQVADTLGPGCRLFAVDGLMPQLAALVECRCSVIMASRLAAVYAPLGEQHHVVSNHVPCHPCYRQTCDQKSPCAREISVEDFYSE